MSSIYLWVSKRGAARIDSFWLFVHGEVEEERQWEYCKDIKLLLLYMNYMMF